MDIYLDDWELGERKKNENNNYLIQILTWGMHPTTRSSEISCVLQYWSRSDSWNSTLSSKVLPSWSYTGEPSSFKAFKYKLIHEALIARGFISSPYTCVIHNLPLRLSKKEQIIDTQTVDFSTFLGDHFSAIAIEIQPFPHPNSARSRSLKTLSGNLLMPSKKVKDQSSGLNMLGSSNRVRVCLSSRNPANVWSLI